MIAPYLASSLADLFKPEIKSQIKIIKDPNSIRMNDFVISTSIPVTLYGNMLTFRQTNKSLKLDEDFLKSMPNCKFNVDHSNPQDPKKYEFRKEMLFIFD